LRFRVEIFDRNQFQILPANESESTIAPGVLSIGAKLKVQSGHPYGSVTAVSDAAEWENVKEKSSRSRRRIFNFGQI